LPTSARSIVSDYLRSDRPDAAASEPLFLVSYPTVASKMIVKRMGGRRVWTLVRDLGERSAIKGLHPHALRHACAVELLKRTKNLRAVQQHLRHRDIQSTTKTLIRILPGEQNTVSGELCEKESGGPNGLPTSLDVGAFGLSGEAIA
jgi:site-specific recombinase XerD